MARKSVAALERQRVYARQYKQRNKEKVASYMEAWRAKNVERIRQYKRDYYQERAKHKPRSKRTCSDEQRRKKREYYHANRAHILEERRAARLRNPLKYREEKRKGRRKYWSRSVLRAVRIRARKKGLLYDLDERWLTDKVTAGTCEMSGIPFEMDFSRGARSPSIDRIDPAGAYTKDNCRVIIWFLNKAMGNLGEEFGIDVFSRVIARREIQTRMLPGNDK